MSTPTKQETHMFHHQCPKCSVVNVGEKAKHKCPDCKVACVLMDDAMLHAYLAPPLPPEPSDAEKLADPEWWRKGPYAPKDSVVTPEEAPVMTILSAEQQAKVELFMKALLAGDV